MTHAGETTTGATRLAVYNLGGGKGFTGSDAYVEQVLQWIPEANPTYVVFPEAFNPDQRGSDHRMEAIAEDIANSRNGHYVVGYGTYAEGGGLLVAARSDAVAAPATPSSEQGEPVYGDKDVFQLVRYAGRGAVETVLGLPESDQTVLMTGIHLDTLKEPRADQLAAYLNAHITQRANGELLGLVGDLNSVSYRNFLTYALWSAGLIVPDSVAARMDSKGLVRLMSVLKRAAQYCEGAESNTLDGSGYVNTAPAHKPTAAFPGLPEGVMGRIEAVPIVGEAVSGALRAPYLGIDQIRLSPGGEWQIVGARVYPIQGLDDHAPVTADVVWRPSKETR